MSGYVMAIGLYADVPVRLIGWPSGFGPVTPALDAGTNSCNGLAFSADGAWLATAHSNWSSEDLIVHATSDWSRVATLAVDQINDPLFAPDGSWLVARQSDINLLIFDTATWTANAASPLSWSYPQSLQHLSMEPTGDRIAACIETYPTGKIAVVDTATWLATDVITTPVRPQASAWSPDGAWLAVGLEGSASDGRARVYDTATWALVATITGAWLSGAKLAWSPDSAQLAVGGTNNLVVYDTATWTAISGAPTDQSSALLIYAPDGSRLSLSDSYGDIKTYLANTWTLDTTVTSPDGASTAAISAAYSVKSVAGTVLDAAGDPAARQVALLDRATLALLDSTTSDASTGAYTLQTFSGEEAVVIALDAADDYNDLIRRVVPD